MKRNIKKPLLVAALTALSICTWADNKIIPQYAADKTDTMKKLALELSTDKCAYKPGETITFTCTGELPSGLKVRYRHLGDIIDEGLVTNRTWKWTAPESDFTGYLIELYTSDGVADYVYGTIAVDVSSDWTHFPRYGFVATFDNTKSKTAISKEMNWLNRCHINGVQFQDWHYAHDCPLAGTRENPSRTYKDIANRTIYLTVIKNYIAEQHAYGMNSIFYNLCFGILDGYQERGVKEQWFAFKDRLHQQKDSHQLPESWKSDIYIANPANTEWQEYLAKRNDDVYAALDFDGYQIDQLGWRGQLYDYNGKEIDLPQGYKSFIQAMKKAHSNKRLVMNAVSEYGAQQIAESGKIDFFYNEVWGNHDYDNYTTPEARFTNLKDIISRNRGFDQSKQTVFAAYMDYLRDGDYFNTAGIVMTDAVMFALGGSHLELGGDHMLCREYFPYAGVKWHDEIEDWMKHYYDFHTAYENLLRGNWSENNIISARCMRPTINKWEPRAGQVTVLARDVENKTVVHFLNFTQNGTEDKDYLLCWHDNKGTRPWPVEYEDMSITITGIQKEAGRVWLASPDYAGGAVQEITDYTTTGSSLKVNIPLQFWTMVVIEEKDANGIEEVKKESHNENLYDLTGRRVGNNYKGIVICDGKAIIK